MGKEHGTLSDELAAKKEAAFRKNYLPQDEGAQYGVRPSEPEAATNRFMAESIISPEHPGDFGLPQSNTVGNYGDRKGTAETVYNGKVLTVG